MKLIVITTPQFFEGEAEAVTSLFQNGLEMLHLRKPGASAEEMGNFLQQLPMEYMPRIVTHEQIPAGIRFRSERNSSERAQSADTVRI